MREKEVLCHYCGQKAELITRMTSMEIKNQEVEYQESFYRCEACDEEFEVGKCINDNLLAARDAYRKKNKLLTSSQIAEISQMGIEYFLLLLPLLAMNLALFNILPPLFILYH